MSVVGELPLDITWPRGFSSADFEFELRKKGHSRQPSHRRTPSLVMYPDERIIGPSLGETRPGTPTAGKLDTPFHQTISSNPGGQGLGAISWGHVDGLSVEAENKSPRTVTPKLARSSVGSIRSKTAADKPDVSEVFGNLWWGSEVKPTAQRSLNSRSSQGSPSSTRSGGIWKFKFSRPKGMLDRSSATSPEGSGDNLNLTIKTVQSTYDQDDCESLGTVVEFDGDSDALSSQAEDADMRNDLYTDQDKGSLGDDTQTNDSIDEEEFPLDTIAESNLESQKTQDLGTLEEEAEAVEITAREIRVNQLQGTRSPVVHSHTVSDSSQPESDMPLPEIVTGSILQGVHDEISERLAEELSMEHKDVSPEPERYQARDRCLDLSKANESKGSTYFGVKWVRLVPDKDLVSKVQNGLTDAKEMLVNNWQFLPVVALSMVLVAIIQ